MSLSESTKQRALRIDLDHHKRPEPLARAKWLLAILAAVTAVMYAAWLYLPGAEAKSHLSPGHVAAAHASLNSRCSECHQDFHALRGDAWAMHKGEFDQASGTWTSDQKCIVCHAAPTHHANLKDVHKIESCGSCHQDHQGMDHRLTRIGDQHCTRCHAKLESLVSERILKEPNSPNVKSFMNAHPKEFRTLEAGDPGKIQFNHALHMRPGLTKTDDGRVLSKYEDIDAEYLKHAIEGWDPAKPLTGAVQLQCASCHEAAGGDDRLAFSALEEKETTRQTPHFASIKFDRHCQACHALKIGPNEQDVVPHRLKADELKQAVFAFLLNKDNVPPTKNSVQEYEDRLLGKPRKDLAAARLVDDPEGRLNGIRTHLATTCTKCHSYADGQNPLSGDVLPAAIPAFWFKHARFDHTAHRAVNCAHCHGEATTATKSSAVMIPKYDACLECHSLASSGLAKSDAAKKFAGARSDCVECHTYHGANDTALHPRLGRTP